MKTRHLLTNKAGSWSEPGTHANSEETNGGNDPVNTFQVQSIINMHYGIRAASYTRQIFQKQVGILCKNLRQSPCFKVLGALDWLYRNIEWIHLQ